MAKKTVITLIIALMITLLPQSSLKASPMFPEIAGWQKGNTAKKEIYSSKTLQGTWSKATFSQKNGHRYVDITMLSGKGFGPFKIFPDINSNDRPVGSGATYRTLMINKYPAVLENYPYIGTALSISMEDNLVVIFESNSIDGKTLVKFAKKVLKRMSN